MRIIACHVLSRSTIDRTHPDYAEKLREATQLAKEIEAEKQLRYAAQPTAGFTPLRHQSDDEEDEVHKKLQPESSGKETKVMCLLKDGEVDLELDEEARFAAVARVSKAPALTSSSSSLMLSGGAGGSSRRGGHSTSSTVPYSRQHSGNKKGGNESGPGSRHSQQTSVRGSSPIVPLLTAADLSAKRNGTLSMAGINRGSPSIHASPPPPPMNVTLSKQSSKEKMPSSTHADVGDLYTAPVSELATTNSVEVFLESSSLTKVVTSESVEVSAAAPSVSETEPVSGERADRKGLNPDAVEFVPRWQQATAVVEEPQPMSLMPDPMTVSSSQGALQYMAMDASQQPAPQLLMPMMPTHPGNMSMTQPPVLPPNQPPGGQLMGSMFTPMGSMSGPRMFSLPFQQTPPRNNMPSGNIMYTSVCQGVPSSAPYMIAPSPSQPMQMVRPPMPMSMQGLQPGNAAAFTLTQLTPSGAMISAPPPTTSMQPQAGAPLQLSVSVTPPGTTMKSMPGAAPSWTAAQTPATSAGSGIATNSLMPHPPGPMQPFTGGVNVGQQLQPNPMFPPPTQYVQPMTPAAFNYATLPTGVGPNAPTSSAPPTQTGPPAPPPPQPGSLMRQRSITSSHSSYSLTSSTPSTPVAPPIMLRSMTALPAASMPNTDPSTSFMFVQHPQNTCGPTPGVNTNPLQPTQAQLFIPALNMNTANSNTAMLTQQTQNIFAAQTPTAMPHQQFQQQQQPHQLPHTQQIGQAQFSLSLGMTPMQGPNGAYYFSPSPNVSNMPHHSQPTLFATAGPPNQMSSSMMMMSMTPSGLGPSSMEPQQAPPSSMLLYPTHLQATSVPPQATQHHQTTHLHNPAAAYPMPPPHVAHPNLPPHAIPTASLQQAHSGSFMPVSQIMAPGRPMY